MGRKDWELAESGLIIGDDWLPTGLRDGEDPDTDERGLWADARPDTRRSPLVEAGGIDDFGGGTGEVAAGRRAGLELAGGFLEIGTLVDERLASLVRLTRGPEPSW